MTDDISLNRWFCSEVLPLERSLTQYIRKNWKVADEVVDIRQEIYERALIGARQGLPLRTAPYLFSVARNHLINRAKHERIVSFALVVKLEEIQDIDMAATERNLSARDELRRALAGIEQLPPRCREVVWLRKVEGLTTREAAERLHVGLDTIEKQLTIGMRALADFMLGGPGKILRPKFRRLRSMKSGKS